MHYFLVQRQLATMVLVPAVATNTIEKAIPIRKYSFFMREKSTGLGFKLYVSEL
jgi:hypothetical protein